MALLMAALLSAAFTKASNGQPFGYEWSKKSLIVQSSPSKFYQALLRARKRAPSFRVYAGKVRSSRELFGSVCHAVGMQRNVSISPSVTSSSFIVSSLHLLHLFLRSSPEAVLLPLFLSLSLSLRQFFGSSSAVLWAFKMRLRIESLLRRDAFLRVKQLGAWMPFFSQFFILSC